MRECLPSGPVHQGLAYAYMVNYLVIALDGKTAEGKGEAFNYLLNNIQLTCLRVHFVLKQSLL